MFFHTVKHTPFYLSCLDEEKRADPLPESTMGIHCTVYTIYELSTQMPVRNPRTLTFIDFAIFLKVAYLFKL